MTHKSIGASIVCILTPQLAPKAPSKTITADYANLEFSAFKNNDRFDRYLFTSILAKSFDGGSLVG